MKAILVKENQRLSWESVADPTPKSDEVVIKIHYAALNRADLMQRAGDYPPPAGCPEWMGLEVSGEIVALGEEARTCSSFQLGDLVCALLGGGGYAQFVAVRYDMAMPIPMNCSMIEAASIPEAFATAYLNLFTEGRIQEGDTLLMHAGASGLASVVIPMAKAYGIRVITTIIDEAKRNAVASYGTDIIVNTHLESIEHVLKRQLDEGNPVDVAIDCLGGDVMGKCLPYMNHGGRWIMIATLAGQWAQIDLKNVYVRNVRIIGSTLRSRKPHVKAQILANLVKEVWPKVSAGLIKPNIYKVLPITDVESAHSILERGESVGKVVLKVIE